MFDRNLEDRIIDRFPYPIAYVFKVMTGIDMELEPQKKFIYLLKTSESIARFIGITALAELAQAIENKKTVMPDSLKYNFGKKFKAPSFGTWVEFAREGYKWLSKEDVECVISQLKTFFYDENGKATAEKDSIDNLVNLRNAYSHDKLNLQTDGDYAEACEVVLEILGEIFESLKYLSEYSFGLIQSIELRKQKRSEPNYTYKGKNLTGVNFSNQGITKLKEPFEHYKETDSVIIRYEQAQTYLNLYPFYVYEENAGDCPDLFFYNGWKNKMEYIACANGGKFKIDNSQKSEDQKKSKKERFNLLMGNTKKMDSKENVKSSSDLENELNLMLSVFRGERL